MKIRKLKPISMKSREGPRFQADLLSQASMTSHRISFSSSAALLGSTRRVYSCFGVRSFSFTISFRRLTLHSVARSEILTNSSVSVSSDGIPVPSQLSDREENGQYKSESIRRRPTIPPGSVFRPQQNQAPFALHVSQRAVHQVLCLFPRALQATSLAA